jgi:hypothetical protein
MTVGRRFNKRRRRRRKAKLQYSVLFEESLIVMVVRRNKFSNLPPQAVQSLLHVYLT